jgi:hypothetical protein
MIKIGDIVEYQYREDDKPYYGIIVGLNDDTYGEYCWVDWFELGIQKARKSFLKVLS